MTLGLMRGTIHRCTKFNQEMYITRGLIKVWFGGGVHGAGAEGARAGWASLPPTPRSAGAAVKKSPGDSREAGQTPGSRVPETRGHPTPRGQAPRPGTPLSVRPPRPPPSLGEA